MELPPGIRPDDRILVLGAFEADQVRALARMVVHGLVVLIANGETLYTVRQALRDLENVMVVPGTPDQLPWRDGFFTRVIGAAGNRAEPDNVRRELERVTTGRTASPEET